MVGCNILGSLCRKICDYCAVRALCDCSSSSIVIVADIKDPGTQQFIARVIQDKDRDLVKILNAVEDNKIPTELKVHRIVQKPGMDQEKIQAAILDIAKHNLGELKGEGGKEEGWSRLSLACHLAGVDLQQRFAELEPITAKELEALKKNVVEVKKYGCSSAVLWKLVCDNVNDWKKLKKIDGMDTKQLNFLRKKLQRVKHSEVQQATFDDLSIELKEIFFEAAKLSKVKVHLSFEPWVLREHSPSSASFGRSPSRSSASRIEEKEEKREEKEDR
ncbi:MAG: hypothetical protein KGJ02_03970 [Verrucomicrobiota bacterium]|nr:hypothetical protein [Verrucomicrobiota bacterium]